MIYYCFTHFMRKLVLIIIHKYTDLKHVHTSIELCRGCNFLHHIFSLQVLPRVKCHNDEDETIHPSVCSFGFLMIRVCFVLDMQS